MFYVFKKKKNLQSLFLVREWRGDLQLTEIAVVSHKDKAD